MRVKTVVGLAFIEPALGAGGVLGRRQIDEGQEVARLEVRGVFLEIGPAFGVDQGRRGLGKAARRIGAGAMALRFDEYRPSRAEPAEGVVEPAGDGDEFGRHRGVEIGTTEAGGALEAAVLVEDDALTHERGPGQEIREAG